MHALIRPPGPESVPPGVEYHRVLAGEDRRVGRGILAIALLVGGMWAAIAAFYYLGRWVDALLLPGAAGDGNGLLTPVSHAGSLVAVALLVPWSMVTQRWLYGTPGPSLHSVTSRFRFALFGRALLAVGPALVLAIAVTELLVPRPTTVWSPLDTIWILTVSLVLLPLQAAGEEYGLRGLVFRVAASWGRGRWTSLILGMAVSAAVFAALHTAGDPWWNVLYAVLSVLAAFITWRTGGVEIAVVLHAVYNVLTFTFWIALGADLAVRFDRSAGAVSAPLLVSTCLVLVGAAVVVGVRTRRTGPARTPVHDALRIFPGPTDDRDHAAAVPVGRPTETNDR